MTEPTTPSRRSLLKAGLLGAGALAAGASLSGLPAYATGLVRGNRPILTHGVASGDVTANSAIIWTLRTARRA